MKSRLYALLFFIMAGLFVYFPPDWVFFNEDNKGSVMVLSVFLIIGGFIIAIFNKD